MTGVIQRSTKEIAYRQLMEGQPFIAAEKVFRDLLIEKLHSIPIGPDLRRLPNDEKLEIFVCMMLELGKELRQFAISTSKRGEL